MWLPPFQIEAELKFETNMIFCKPHKLGYRMTYIGTNSCTRGRLLRLCNCLNATMRAFDVKVPIGTRSQSLQMAGSCFYPEPIIPVSLSPSVFDPCSHCLCKVCPKPRNCPLGACPFWLWMSRAHKHNQLGMTHLSDTPFQATTV